MASQIITEKITSNPSNQKIRKENNGSDTSTYIPNSPYLIGIPRGNWFTQHQFTPNKFTLNRFSPNEFTADEFTADEFTANKFIANRLSIQ